MSGGEMERGLVFPCGGESLVGVLAAPPAPKPWGVVVLVGGPQYRGGSHRQFVCLARALAEAGYACLRFDYRGMGDSTGTRQDFRNLDDDVEAAVDALLAHCPAVKRVVLWGLCDAASAALLYCQRTRDPRVGGLCLVNPWVRSEATQAKTQLKHYYVRRLLSGQFWRKLAGGEVPLAPALEELLRKLALAVRRPSLQEPGEMPFQDAMACAWRQFPGPILLLMSGRDDTAREFEENAASSPLWLGLLTGQKVRRVDFPDADHTFSGRSVRQAAEQILVGWLALIAQHGRTELPTGARPLSPSRRGNRLPGSAAWASRPRSGRERRGGAVK